MLPAILNFEENKVMLCRLLLIAVLFSGFTAMAVAQNPADEDAFGGSSDE